jgi:NAD(P)-dependent dehydrogenase (short-subunit alcohol dehydrogenase family)
MKVVITGTTRGLGKATKEYLKSLYGYTVIDLNRPQYDLDANLADFVISDFDVYINNAYSGWTQVDLLYKLYEANKNRTCMIVNIGSVSADGNYDYANAYAVHKAALDKACMQMQLMNTECRVVQIKLGRMDTDMVKEKPGPKLDPGWVAQQIGMIINFPYNVLPKTLVFDNACASR